jgi:catechol 2,3-dioxygenase-like lactoylglutathione lyase family enzyme
MATRLEHANLAVRDVDATIRFLSTAFPEFRTRFDGLGPDGRRWVHYGTDDTYMALSESTVVPKERWAPYEGRPGVNHIAYVVDDADAVRRRLSKAGYTDSTVENGVIDPTTYDYFVSICGMTSTTIFYGARISYTNP